MESELAAPYIVSHVVALICVFIARLWPSLARWIAGLGFVTAGAFNLRTASTTPRIYVEGFGPYAFPPYREFIHGAFALHTTAFVSAIACGQIAAGGLALAPLPWRRLGYAGAIVFPIAITGLGVGAAVPSNLVFAAGIAALSWRSRSVKEALAWSDAAGAAGRSSGRSRLEFLNGPAVLASVAVIEKVPKGCV
jgi:hypothetical protein